MTYLPSGVIHSHGVPSLSPYLVNYKYINYLIKILKYNLIFNVSTTNYDIRAAPLISTNESHSAKPAPEDLRIAMATHGRCHGDVKVNATLRGIMRWPTLSSFTTYP